MPAKGNSQQHQEHHQQQQWKSRQYPGTWEPSKQFGRRMDPGYQEIKPTKKGTPTTTELTTESYSPPPTATTTETIAKTATETAATTEKPAEKPATETTAIQTVPWPSKKLRKKAKKKNTEGERPEEMETAINLKGRGTVGKCTSRVVLPIKIPR